MKHAFHVWIVLQLLATAGQVPVWRSEVTLWTHAAKHAPEKPRAWVNLGRALLLVGQPDYAEQAFYRGLSASQATHVTGFDRADAAMAVQMNLQTVTLMRTVRGMATE